MAPENDMAIHYGALSDALQWGRGRMAPENHDLRQRYQALFKASMGPGPDGPGKRA